MKSVRFYFDVVSPYAYLAFEHLPQALAGCHYVVDHQPVLLAGLLGHWGHKGPAEIAPKRTWTYRHCSWLAHTLGVPLQLPARHPFNPLALLRLGLACGPAGALPGRHTVARLMRHVWCGGADPEDAQRQAAVLYDLQPLRDPAAADVKHELRAGTEAAAAAGVFGVPAFEVGGRLLWGLDALPMLRAALCDDAWFDGAAWNEAAGPRPSTGRPSSNR